MTGSQERQDAGDHVDVLVVGAGPTGLMLANWLVKLGVRVLIIDAKAGPTLESRALGVQSRSMEIFDQLGVVDPVLDHAVHADSMRQGFERRSFAPIPLTKLGQGITPYPGMYLLEQSANESILTARLELLGESVRWRHRLVALDQDAGGVQAVVDGPSGSRTLRARFAVGCDGAASTVRSLSGIAFEGTTSRQTFYLIDAQGVTGLDPASVNIRQGASEFLLAFPMRAEGARSNAHRLIGIAGDGDAPAITEEWARGRLSEVFGVQYRDSRWFSTYRVHHRIASRFRQGSVFLAGDAAHVHSPVGAQGMNTGLQDAHNLAFKLAEVLDGQAPETLLDRYGAERRPVAERLLRTTDAFFRVIISRSRAATWARRQLPRILLPVVVALLPRLPVGRRVAGYLGQLRIHYRMADGAPRRRRDAVVGRRLPWTGHNFDVLRAAEWQVHLYAADAAVTEGARTVARELELPLTCFPDIGATVLRPGVLYLVRPDGFVASAARPHDAVSAFTSARGHRGA
jgi:2-polyprenyl-6-methoxyphenol hydroxylase-like FAD-dependent oxidoreductase